MTTYTPPPSGKKYGPGKWINRQGKVREIELFSVFGDLTRLGKYWHPVTGAHASMPSSDLIEPADDETAARYGWTKEE